MYGNTYENSWFEITLRFGFNLNLVYYESYNINICFIFGNMFFKLPYKNKSYNKFLEWGIKYYDRSIHVNFGKYWKIIELPWFWTHYSTTYYDINGKDCTNLVEDEYNSIIRCNLLKAPFYNFKNTTSWGELQVANLTRYYCERLEWRWKIFKFLPFPRLVKNQLWIEFNKGMGDSVAKWTGGTTGMSFIMLKNETPLQSIQRLESIGLARKVKDNVFPLEYLLVDLICLLFVKQFSFSCGIDDPCGIKGVDWKFCNKILEKVVSKDIKNKIKEKFDVEVSLL